MVFYITIAKALIGYRGAFKLCKYLFIRFAKGVGQNIESAPVCHAYNHFFYFIFTCCFVDDGIKGGYCGFSAF